MTDTATSPSPAAAAATAPIVIIGGGHAGAALCSALAAAGAGARVHLVCDEPRLPYQRPPLSKAFIKNPEEQPQPHKAAAWYADQGITLHLGDAATAIDVAGRSVTLASGQQLPWGQLVLATGARARQLPGLQSESGQLLNVHTLRVADDAIHLRHALGDAASVTVLGGGFIGLEIAATARALGKPVTVLESATRLLQRSVSPELAEHVLASHRAAGITITLGAKISDLKVANGRVTSVTVNGQAQPVDLLVLGIGATPDTALAVAAGLACHDGVVVDAQMRSSVPGILAIGDCARFPANAWAPSGQDSLRLESVQNANDQAKTAAATLLADGATAQDAVPPYNAMPWFWSEQGPLRLQMVGLMPVAAQADGTLAPRSTRHRRPGANDQSFSVFHYLDDRLVCVESVNAPMDHMMAKKLIEAGRHPAPAQATDPAVALKTLV